jgi:Insertion element 4 transposase N-terminal/Transposase DDE domain
MPRAGWVKPSDDQRLSDHVALGVLTRTFPPELVDTVVRAAGREQQRHRLLPSRLVTYYVLAMTLFSNSGYEEVMRNLVEGLSWGSGWAQSWTVPSQPAISQARTRLGVEPLAELFARACVPLATPETPGAFYRARRLVSIDGTCLDVADTAENTAAFGRPGSARGSGEGAFPQLRVVALAECGTHAMFAAAMGPYASGESSLARGLIGGLGAGMLVLADRGFTGHPLFAAYAATGADLLWRAKNNAVLPVLQRHRDGSFRSEIVANDDRHARNNVLPVRVVEYRIDDPGRPQTDDNAYRLITTILDPKQAPAAELAPLYAERWEFESALDELKVHQRGPRVVLRSKTPDGVRQEAWGYLCTHYAIRALMATAADDHGGDPDRISFTRSLHAARRSVRAGLGHTAHSLAVALPATMAEICRELVPRRRLRAAPRVVKRKMSNYNVKRAEHRHWPQPTRAPLTAVRILRRELTQA